MVENEFGFRMHQMRTPNTVKNANIFEVVGVDLVEHILVHGDVNDKDLEKLAESGRHFLVFFEGNPWNGWHPWFEENQEFWPEGADSSWQISSVNVVEFSKFAPIQIKNRVIQRKKLGELAR